MKLLVEQQLRHVHQRIDDHQVLHQRGEAIRPGIPEIIHGAKLVLMQ